MASSRRYIPKIESVQKAAEELPDPESWRSDTFHVPLKDEHLLEFKRVKFRGKLGGATYKWIYDGRVQVN